MGEADKALSDAMAALDRMTVESIEAADIDEVRALEAAAHHWAEIAASVLKRRSSQPRHQVEGCDDE